MADGDLVESLAELGFEKVDSGLPGGWASDGEWTVCIQSRRTPMTEQTTTFEHRVFVYDGAPDRLSVGDHPVARTVDDSHELAVRRALDQAGYYDTREVTTDA